MRELRRRYGKLSVLRRPCPVAPGERRRTYVKCQCGVVKTVLVDALLSGRTRSCGAYACKHGARKIRVDLRYRPYGTNIADKLVRGMWRETQYRRRTVEDVALGFMVNKYTLHSLLRAIKRCGGVDRYLRLVNERSSK